MPTTGIEVGYTQDAATFTYKQNKQEVEAEQSLNPVDVFIVNEEIQIEFNAMEHVYNSLKTAFDNVGSVDDDEKMLFYGGDGGGAGQREDAVRRADVAHPHRADQARSAGPLPRLQHGGRVDPVQPDRRGALQDHAQGAGRYDTRSGGSVVPVVPREAAVHATGAVAGSPGTWFPVGSGVPGNLAAMGPVQPVNVGGTPVLTAWTTGQHMVLGDASQCNWNGTAWVVGTHALAASEGGAAAPESGPSSPLTGGSQTQPGQPPPPQPGQSPQPGQPGFQPQPPPGPGQQPGQQGGAGGPGPGGQRR